MSQDLSKVLTGTITHIAQPQTRSYNGKDYTNQMLLLQVENERYPDKPHTFPIEMVGKSTDHLDTYKAGDHVTITCDLRGRAYNNKATGEPSAFLSIAGWKIERAGQQAPSGGYNAAPKQAPVTADTGHNDDLPF